MTRCLFTMASLGVLACSQLAAQVAPPLPPTPPSPPAARTIPWPYSPPNPPVPPAAGLSFRAPGLVFAPPAPRSYLGVHLIEVGAERAKELGMSPPYGVEIMSVAAGSPAENAGIRKNDVLIEFRGQRVEGQEQLVRLVRETPIGRKTPVTVIRNGSKVNLEVEIGSLEPAPHALFNCGNEPCEIRVPEVRIQAFDFDIPKPRMVTQSRMLGAELESIDGQLAEYFGVNEGVLVRSVDSDSPASRAGLKAGDVIVQVAGRTVRDSAQIRDAARSAAGRKTVAMQINRNRSRVTLQLETQEPASNWQRHRGRSVGNPGQD